MADGHNSRFATRSWRSSSGTAGSSKVVILCSSLWTAIGSPPTIIGITGSGIMGWISMIQSAASTDDVLVPYWGSRGSTGLFDRSASCGDLSLPRTVLVPSSPLGSLPGTLWGCWWHRPLPWYLTPLRSPWQSWSKSPARLPPRWASFQCNARSPCRTADVLCQARSPPQTSGHGCKARSPPCRPSKGCTARASPRWPSKRCTARASLRWSSQGCTARSRCRLASRPFISSAACLRSIWAWSPLAPTYRPTGRLQ